MWATRKAAVQEVLDALSEGLGKKPAQCAEQLGIETDADAKVDIKDFATPQLQRPRAGAGGGGAGAAR